MKDIDVAKISYAVTLITEKGEAYDITEALTSLAWEEQEGQLAQKATLRVAANCKAGKTRLRSVLKLNCLIRIFGRWGDGKKKLFEGAIWEWQFTRSENRELDIVVYDPLIRLQQSKDFMYFSKGMTTQAILGGICGNWGISLDYKWEKQVTHPKEAFHGEAVSDMIMKVLEEVRRKTGSRYAVRHKDGKLQVVGFGSNKDVYIFENKNTFRVTDKRSLNNLVTMVTVIGKADEEGRAGVEAVVKGNLDFGVLQEIVQKDGDKDIGSAMAEAGEILKERGKPEASFMATAFDLPFLRKGDAVQMKAGNLEGEFYVAGVSHNATQKQMTMTLLKKRDA